jgi:preprotein translocase subunit SecB
MTDLPPAGLPTGANADEAPSFRVLAQFIRDLSFENPRAPESLRAQAEPPQIDLSVEMNARSRPDGLYETDLKLVVTAQAAGESVFQIELLFGGLFQITGIPEADMEPVLLIECPRYLFPFARRLIADLTGESGFPPFMLEPIDFGAVYQARRAAGSQEVGQA